MNLSKVRIEIGLPAPLRLLHVSDTHLALADGRDGERKQALAARRSAAFGKEGDCLRSFSEAVAYARNCCDLMICTGDLIDFVSAKNLDTAKEMLSGTDYFFAAGNHEFSKYVGEAVEDEAYKLDSLPLVQRYIGNDLRFASRLVGGVNLVAVDNSYYLFRPEELEAFRREVEKGYPILLLLHNPLHTDALYREMMVNRRNECAYLVGTPEELLEPYPEERRSQQRADGPTLAFIDYLKQQTLVKAVLTGHLHFNFDSVLYGDVVQYTAGGNFRRDVREYEIV